LFNLPIFSYLGMQVGLDVDIGTFRNPRPYKPKLGLGVTPGFEVVGHRDFYARSITLFRVKEVIHGGKDRCTWTVIDGCGNEITESSLVIWWDKPEELYRQEVDSFIEYYSIPTTY